MARGFCVGIGEFLTFSAMVLAILVNMGQLTENIVARHLYLVNADLSGVQAAGNGGLGNNVFAQNQASPLLQGNGLRNEYYWGMYSVCGGQGVSGERACSRDRFINIFDPVSVFEEDAGNANVINALPADGVLRDEKYVRNISHAAIIILFAGTVAAGLAFFVGFLAHRFAFLVSALLSLLGAACLLVAAALWTALIAKIRNSLENVNVGIVFHYGQSIWMTWAAGGACLLAFVPLVISCCTGRRDKY